MISNEQKRAHPEDPKTAIEVRFLEVKGRTGVGEIAVTTNEYRAAERLKNDYWLYVVYDSASTPKLHAIRNPVTLGWRAVSIVEHYICDSSSILTEEEKV